MKNKRVELILSPLKGNDSVLSADCVSRSQAEVRENA